MSDPKHSRRDFLRGRAALGAAAQIVQNSLEAILPSEPVTNGDRGRLSPVGSFRKSRTIVLARRAMACEFELRFNATEEENPTEAGMVALDLIEQIEDQLTVYRDHSELIDINERAATEPVDVDPRLFKLLQLADTLWRQSDGAFDLTCGPLSRVWGFSNREGKMPEPDALEQARTLVGWQQVELDPTAQTVRFRQPGVEINVNSIGKGYALDRAGELLAEWEVNDSFMHGGGSTLLARGDSWGLESGGWLAGIRDPLQPERRLAQIVLRNEALSSSGDGTQFFEHDGRRYGHLIDPRTGMPTEGLLMATAIAPTAAEADALSTAFYLLGVEGTERFCQQRPDVGALLLAQAPGDTDKTEVHRFNLDGRETSPESSK